MGNSHSNGARGSGGDPIILRATYDDLSRVHLDDIKERREVVSDVASSSPISFDDPPFLRPGYRKDDIMNLRVNPKGISVWDYYENTGHCLGSGLSGDIFKIKNKYTGVEYAYKHFQLKGLSKKQLKIQYNEIDLYMGMSHPNVAALIEIFCDTSSFGLVMELCSGGNLCYYRLTHDAVWTDDLTKAIFFQMVMVVKSLHDNDIAVRDIKLDNFVVYQNDADQKLDLKFLRQNIRPKIIDFGISRKIKAGVPMTTRHGTVEYMAPEVFNSIYDLKADIWSLGCCLFALLFAKFPYEQSTILKGHTKNIHYGVDREFPRVVGADLRHLLGHLLSYDPDKRPTCEEILFHPWLKSEMDYVISSHEKMIDENDKPTKMGLDVLNTVGGFYKVSPITRAAMAYASRYLPSTFKIKHDTFFLGVTQGRDQILLSDISGRTDAGKPQGTVSEQKLSRTFTEINGFSSDAAVLVDSEKEAVKTIRWFEYLAAMMLAHVAEDRLEVAVHNILRSKGYLDEKDEKALLTREECSNLFGGQFGLGTKTLEAFDKLLQDNQFFVEDKGEKKLDLLALVLKDKEKIMKT